MVFVEAGFHRVLSLTPSKRLKIMVGFIFGGLMRLWLRVVLGIVVLLIVLVAVAAVKVLGPRAFLGPRARPLTSRTFGATPARIERGKYLASSIGCLYCHSPHDWSKPDDPILPGMEGAGQQLPYSDLPGRIVAPNLTPDKETGAGNWADDMLARSIREGIGHDGRALFAIMPYAYYRNMPDEDMASIIVYLRSLPAVKNPLPKTDMIFPVKYIIRNAPQPVISSVPIPDLSTPVKRGEYLVNLIGCVDCHTPVDNHHQAIPGMEYSGGQIIQMPWAKAASSNITPDPSSGISYYGEAMFIKAMRTGYVGTRQLNKMMPWPVFRNLSDEDLAGMFAYLKTLKPVVHHVSNAEPPTLCPLDNTMHGAGNENVKR